MSYSMYKRPWSCFDLLQNSEGKKINSRQKQNTEKQSELAAQHSQQNELSPRQTEKITAAK